MNKVFIGDFGAGNTCLYSVVLDADIPKPKALNDVNGEPSGYCVDQNGNYVLGLGLYGLTYEDAVDAELFHINIKAKPNNENEAELTSYFSAWLHRLKERYPVEFQNIENTYWLVGCPTGDEWKEKSTRERYQRIFENAGFENVMVIPESNAALAYYQKTSGALDDIDPEAGLLLLDQGAYSLDATYFRKGEIRSKGSYLGAGLIEQMIVKTILTKPEESYRCDKKSINLPETIKLAAQLYNQVGEQGKKFRTYLLLQARMLKEDYFTMLQKGTLSNTRDLKKEVEIGVDEPLILFINRKMMQDMLNQPVRSILGEDFNTLHPEVRDEIGADSWIGAFEKFLCNVDSGFPEFKRGCNSSDASGKQPVILLTGGGSMMTCIEETVVKHYKGAAVYKDYNAVSAIGQGMAYWAPDKIRAENFSNAFSELLDKTYIDEDGDELSLVQHYFVDAFMECIKPMAQDVVKAEAEAVVNGIKKWAEYSCESREIPNQIQSYLDNWIKQTEIPSMRVEIDKQVEVLKEKLNSDFAALLQQYGFKNQKLLSADNQVFLSDSKQLLLRVFEIVEEVIVDHYKKKWADDNFAGIFMDAKKGFFSDKRAEILSACAENLGKWVEHETDATIDLVVQTFFKWEVKEVLDDKYTFHQYFVIEGVCDMLNLIEERKKELLGHLVLEEYMAE